MTLFKAELYDYFNGLLNTANSNSNELDNNRVTSYITDQPMLDDLALFAIDYSLNCPISFNEVVDMIKWLKSGKAEGLHMLNADVFENLNGRFISALKKHFNKILYSGEFPEEWMVCWDYRSPI